MPTLTIVVRFHEGRYHGAGDWPPAPARLFQALVAAAARGDEIPGPQQEALQWLARLEPPTIFAPAKSDGQAFRNYVPNNDLDSVGGDPNRIPEIKTTKSICPKLFDPDQALTYRWSFPDTAPGRRNAQVLCTVADDLYQLGRGTDMAWARAATGYDQPGHDADPGYTTYLPSGGAGQALPCPAQESLASLRSRYLALRSRLAYDPDQQKTIFTQPPKPRFRQVSYNAADKILLFELLGLGAGQSFAPWPLRSCHLLTIILRDLAAGRLRQAMPGRLAAIDRALIGRNARDGDKIARIRITPVPSIGHPHADLAIRRLLVAVPSNCPLEPQDVAWAFSGLSCDGRRLVPAQELTMLAHLGILNIGSPSRLWRTITPAVLPFVPTPASSGGTQRLERDQRLANAVLQALRHAGLPAQVSALRVQRESFDGNGEPASAFAAAPRFAAPRLWHVEVTFAEPVLHGPIVIGDGRYLGLGLMAPARLQDRPIFCFPLRSPQPLTDAERPALLHAVRRALMSVARDPDGRIPKLISGHEEDGASDRSGSHDHVFLAATAEEGPNLSHLVVAAPWATHKSRPPRPHEIAILNRVTGSLREVRAGKLGMVHLGVPESPTNGHPLLGPARDWQSHTSYCPTRHPHRNQDPRDFLTADILTECLRRDLPIPSIEIFHHDQSPKGGLLALARLRFAVAVTGPIMLGRDSHAGGGLFLARQL